MRNEDNTLERGHGRGRRGRRFGHGHGHGFDRETLMAAMMARAEEGVDEVRAVLGRRGKHAMVRGLMGAGAFGGRGGFGEGFPGGRGGWGMGPGGPGGGRDGGGRGGPGGGRRKRLFDQAELQTLLLALIAESPRHGYDLIREIEALSGGDYAPSPGVVYPALTYMEESGLIAPVADETSRKAFALTDEGRARAETDSAKAAELKERLTALAAQRDKVDPAPVRRAMHALKTAMFDRLSQDGADRELVLKVADAIDEATRKIERIEG
ncbi:PadR family transcriptional regulator [Novosphingobium barchaimii LL02]|uniref:PadR family transcriptional regulator n=2 Tax=Novosphingobium barchaimii TaxID=1420591 RepID=A0A0J7Y5R9_9SPHN|nr:PadR family transcriptional regulator [Novosphingobium barchaimii LL02]